MKKIYTVLIIPLAVSNLSAVELSVQQIENMVKRIHVKRPGIGLEKLEQTPEPFVQIKKEETEEKKTVVKIVTNKENEDNTQFSLHALMNGRAFINDAWREQNETVLGYQVVYVGKRGVVLRKQNYIKTLFLPSKSKSKGLIKIEEGE